MLPLEATGRFNVEAAPDAHAPPSNAAVAAFFEACAGGGTTVIRDFAKNYPGYINIRRKDRTGLMVAADSRFESTVKLLLELGADPNIVEDNGMTALIYASARGNKKVCQALLDAKADARARADDGKTVLYYAAANNHSELLELFLDRGAAKLIDEPDVAGATPLWKALSYGYEKAATVLVDRGASLDVSVDGETLVDMAQRKNSLVLAAIAQKSAQRAEDLVTDVHTGTTGGISRSLKLSGPLKFVKGKAPAAAPPTEPLSKTEAWRASTRGGRNFKF